MSQHVCGDGSIVSGELEDCPELKHVLYIARRDRWVKEMEDAWERLQRAELNEAEPCEDP